MIENIYSKEKFDVDVEWSKLNDTDKTYCKLLVNILKNGIWKQNRTGTKTLSIFGPQVEFKNVGEKFPLLTQKKIHARSVIGELLWFLSGSTNKHELKEKYGCSIWDEWGDDETGELGPIYGHQWVNWKDYKTRWVNALSGPGMNVPVYINQIQNIIDTLKTNPDDRRMIVSAWNVAEIPEMALPPCHWSFQFYTNQIPGEEKRRLHIIENQRSVDTFLGLPFNIASYALLLMMVAQQVDMIPGNLIMNLGDTHIYEDHLKYVTEQLSRNSKGNSPTVVIDKQKDIWSYKPEHFHLEGYTPHPNWKNIPVAV
jgi:thymidylate synthase